MVHIHNGASVLIGRQGQGGEASFLFELKLRLCGASSVVYSRVKSLRPNANLWPARGGLKFKKPSYRFVIACVFVYNYFELSCIIMTVRASVPHVTLRRAVEQRLLQP